MLTLSAILLSHNLRRPIGRFIRVISTSSNPFPFPRSSNPSPYQIFHLTPGVSQADVKQRYYDLVRLYHPDSPVSRTIHPDPAVRQARFHSITAAYEALQTGDPAREAQKRNDYHAQQEALRRAYRRRRAVDEVSVDGQWKDKLIFGVVLLTLTAAMAQAVVTRRQSVAEMVARSRSAPRETHKLEDDQHKPPA